MPASYNTPEQLKSAATEYFLRTQGLASAEDIGRLQGSCPEKVTNAGFALQLGFSNYREFLALRSRGPDWATVIDWCHSAIEHAIVTVAQNPTHKNVRGAELVLSTHFKYSSKTQIDVSSSIQAVMDAIVRLVTKYVPASQREDFLRELLAVVDGDTRMG